MICLVGKLPVLQIGRHQVAGYDTGWIDIALQRAAKSCDRSDFPFIDDIRDGILHYLEHKCPWRVLPIEDLFQVCLLRGSRGGNGAHHRLRWSVSRRCT